MTRTPSKQNKGATKELVVGSKYVLEIATLTNSLEAYIIVHCMKMGVFFKEYEFFGRYVGSYNVGRLDVIIFFYRCDQILSHKSNSNEDIY